MNSNSTTGPLLSPGGAAHVASASPLQRLQFIAKDVKDLLSSGSRGGQKTGPDCQIFDRLALQLFRAQFDANLRYRRFCEGRGVEPATVRSWAEIPAIPAAAFKELALTSLPESLHAAVFHSSGTTEQRPSRHFHSDESLILYEKSLLAYFRAILNGTQTFRPVLRNAPLPILMLTPPPAAAPNSSLVHMFATVRGELGNRKSIFASRATDDGWELDLERVLPWLQEVANTREAVLVLGTAFSYVHLADALGGRTISLPQGSIAMETGGYKGRSRVLSRPELHRLISERLGIPQSHILCEYGMSELSSQAYAVADEGTAVEQSRVFYFPAWTRLQIVSPETGHEVQEGETGLIRIFDLANVFSVMAIQTEDLGVRRGDGCELAGRARSAEPRGCSLMAS